MDRTFFLQMPRQLAAVGKSRTEVDALRTRRLRRLLAVAKERSPFHRERLAHVDPSRFTLDDLASLPTMTKPDVLDNFDRIVTDPRVTLAGAFEFLRRRDADAWLLDRYKVVSSAGSSGRIGVWVYDRRGWAELQTGNMRMTVRDILRHPLGMLRRPVIAVVAAAVPTHLSNQAAKAASSRWIRVRHFEVSASLSSIIAGLDETRPTMLSGYPSLLAELAGATLDGRLRIAPERVICSAEPLLDEQRSIITEAWGSRIANLWASSEGGPLAAGCFEDRGMHLLEDQVIFEPVDEHGRPVDPGQPSDRIYITPLFNHAMPTIRYELDDRVCLIESPCRCGSTLRRIEDIEGRCEDVFRYPGGVRVHAYALSATLYSLEAELTDYQMFQTERGVRLVLRTRGGAIDELAIRLALIHTLREQGLAEPTIELEIDGPLRRLPSGKLKRHVPLHFDLEGRAAG